MRRVIHPIVQKRLEEIRRLCALHRVRRLELFGSAATGRFDPARSDLDFLVEFEDATPVQIADAYFGLMFGLEDLFGRPIDLVTVRSISNPYFLRGIATDRTQLYAA